MKFTKNKFGFTLVPWLLLLGIIALLAALFIPKAEAQFTVLSGTPQTGQPNFAYNDTNYASYYVTNGQTLSYTAGSTNTYQKTVRQNQGLSLMLMVWSTNNMPSSTSTNYTVRFDVTQDGVSWTRGSGAYPIVWTVPLVGNTGPFTNVYWTNMSSLVLSNIRKIQATQVGTTAATNLNAALQYSQSVQ
jgi:hypothetical protein